MACLSPPWAAESPVNRDVVPDTVFHPTPTFPFHQINNNISSTTSSTRTRSTRSSSTINSHLRLKRDQAEGLISRHPRSTLPTSVNSLILIKQRQPHIINLLRPQDHSLCRNHVPAHTR